MGGNPFLHFGVGLGRAWGSHGPLTLGELRDRYVASHGEGCRAVQVIDIAIGKASLGRANPLPEHMTEAYIACVLDPLAAEPAVES
jgi:class 3 adenylate cyclase